MPGAGFKAKAKEWNVVVRACADDPFNFVKEQLVCPLSTYYEGVKLMGNVETRQGKYFYDGVCFAQVGRSER